jgi:predicted cupin superfamily sugar epimerase
MKRNNYTSIILLLNNTIYVLHTDFHKFLKNELIHRHWGKAMANYP